MAAQAPAWPFRDNRATAEWTRRLAWAQAGLAALVALLMFLGIGTAPPPSVLEQKGAVAGGMVDGEMPLALLMLAQFLTFVACAVIGGRWIYVAQANARAMGATDMMVSPGWAVGWFFVPLMNLVMPYIAMRDLWRASDHPRDWQAASAPPTLILWWLLWLGSNIAGTVAWRMEWEMAYDSAGAIATADLISNALLVPAALLFAAIVGGIQQRQEQNGPAQLFR